MTLRDLFRDKDRRYLLLTASLAFLALGTSQALYGPLYPWFRESLSLSGSAVGLIASFHFFGATVAVLVAGFVLRRVGFKAVIIAGACIFSAGYFGFATSSRWGGILASALLLGLGFGTLVSFNLFIDDYFGPLGAAALNLTNMFFGIGAILGPLLAGISLSLGGHRLAFLAGGAVALLLLAMTLRLRQHHPVAETDRSGAGTALAGTVVFLVFLALYIAAEASASNWIPTSLTRNHAPPFVASTMAMVWLAVSAGRLAAVPLSVHLAPHFMVLGSVGCATGMFLLARFEPAAPLAYIATGFFLGPVYPATVSWIRRVFPSRAARIAATVMAGGGLGGIFGPPLVGAATDTFSTAVIPLAIALILVASLLTGLGITVFFPSRPTSAGKGQEPGREDHQGDQERIGLVLPVGPGPVPGSAPRD
ncbi:MFS transporter [Alkalispirochaeta americana]|nr:MFS transporter [Alkalispirochaeta americana]